MGARGLDLEQGDQAVSYGRMREEERRLKVEIAEMVKQAQAQDAAEDAQRRRAIAASQRLAGEEIIDPATMNLNRLPAAAVVAGSITKPVLCAYFYCVIKCAD